MTLLPVLLSIVGGVASGYLLRKKSVVRYTSRLLNGVIMLLLFFLGISVGSNQQLVTRFAAIGMDALLLTLGGTLGSLFCARWVYKQLFQRNNNHTPTGKRDKQEKP